MSANNTDEQIRHIIRHALGLPFTQPGKFRRRWSYRNYYCGSYGLDEECENIVARGYMRRVGTLKAHGMSTYVVTAAGITFAGLDHKVRAEDRKEGAS